MDVSLPSSLRSGPLIIRTCGERNQPTPISTPVLINPFRRTSKKILCPEMEGRICFGSIGHHLFLQDCDTKECFFLDQISMSKIVLPKMLESSEDTSDRVCNLSVSSSVTCPDCIVICTFFKINTGEGSNKTDNFIFFCRLNVDKWTKIPITLADDDVFVGTNIVHQGKLYAQTWKGVLVFDIPSLFHGGNIEMKMIKGPIDSKYPKRSTRHSYMVESLGGIFMVRIHLRAGLVVDIDIHRLDVSAKGIWERVDTIDDRAFFLDHTRGLSVCAKDVGVQPNCIYSTLQCHGGRLCKFCLDDKTFTSNLIWGGSIESSFCWIVPSRHGRIITEEGNFESVNFVPNELPRILKDDVETQAVLYGPWADLPIDLFELLLPRLSSVDFIRIRAVCNAWKSISSTFSKVKTWPWLMYHANADGTYKFLDPLYRKEYTTKLESLRLEDKTDRIRLVSSKNGWIIALIDNDRKVLMVNPLFPNNVFSSPSLPNTYNFDGITFSSVPTCPDCVVFMISADPSGDFLEIYLWQPALQDVNWDKITVAKTDFALARANPIYAGEDFYCLGRMGDLGGFNLKSRVWKVMYNSESIYKFMCSDTYGQCYLLELESRELICVITKNNKEDNIEVLKLDRNKMSWGKQENLGDVTIFLNPGSSHAKSLPHTCYNKKIFLTAFSQVERNKCLTYCMESKRTNMESYNLKNPIDCVWFEPNMHN